MNVKKSLKRTLLMMLLMFPLLSLTTHASQKPLTIVLDPGHGGHDSGAVAFGAMEKDLNLKVAEYTKEELSLYKKEGKDIEIYLTRDDDRFIGLKERTVIAEEKDADLFVSLHMNASVKHNRTGASVYISIKEPFHEQTKELGEYIVENLAELGLDKEGVKTRKSKNSNNDYYSVIRNSTARNIPAILIEHGYMDNQTDYAFMDSEYDLRRFGMLNARAIAEYYELEKEEIKLWDLWGLNEKLIQMIISY